MKIVARGLTDVGQKRDHNEDSFLVDEDLGLFIVADGMGGHAGGGTASKIAVEAIREGLDRAKKESPEIFVAEASLADHPVREQLRQAVESACASIYRVAQEEPALNGMGTTVTAAFFANGYAFLAHVGDSRCYLVRKERIYQVSEDHSLVNEQLKLGSITPDEARHSRFKNIITRSVGFEQEVQVDLMGLETALGDRFVICCDGLSNMIEDHEILRTVTECDLKEAPQKLIDLANSRGGDDNITVVLIQVVDA
jgi:protein phosphatase